MTFPDFSQFCSDLLNRNPGEKEFHQAVCEVFKDIFEFVQEYPDYQDPWLLLRLTEPDQSVLFRVSWEDDRHQIQVNRGYLVRFSNALGPYQGGLRFRPSVNLSIMKFLAYEQMFKNSLLPHGAGGAMGGSDFNPSGKSDREIKRFCQNFMPELLRYAGELSSLPAGDQGVGDRELGYLSGQYRRMRDEGAGLLSENRSLYGGGLFRTEATGYGLVYFAAQVLAESGEGLENKVCTLSGSGKVAIHAAEKLIDLGARVVSLSDSSGTLYDRHGLDEDKLSCIRGLKFLRYGRLPEAADALKCEFHEAKNPWHIPCDLAFPCATENEIRENDAALLVRHGCRWVLEGASMPVSPDAVRVFQESQVILVPGKAASTGGVAVSGPEMTRNATGQPLSREKADELLRDIMSQIHSTCLPWGSKGTSPVNYIKGANIAAFIRLAKNLKFQGD